MAEPYRWGAPPPAAVQYRRARAIQRHEVASINWHLAQRELSRSEGDSRESVFSAQAESPALPPSGHRS